MRVHFNAQLGYRQRFELQPDTSRVATFVMAPPQLRIGNLTEPLISVEDAAVLQEEQESALWTPLSVTKEAGRWLHPNPVTA